MLERNRDCVMEERKLEMPGPLNKTIGDTVMTSSRRRSVTGQSKEYSRRRGRKFGSEISSSPHFSFENIGDLF